MSESNFRNDRRRLLRGALMGAAAAPIGTMALRGSNAIAQDLPKLAEDNPQAVALNYVEDATEKDDMREPGANCGNCRLYLGGRDDEWGGCTAFPGKAVNTNGWCSAWVKASG